MKNKIYLLSVLVLSFVGLNAKPSHFYYYKGQKVELIIDREYLHIIADSEFLQSSKSNQLFQGVLIPIPRHGSKEVAIGNDPSAFFKTFDIFNVSSLAKAIGIDSSLMRQYKTGKTYISEARKKQIETGIHQIANELLDVKF